MYSLPPIDLTSTTDAAYSSRGSREETAIQAGFGAKADTYFVRFEANVPRLSATAEETTTAAELRAAVAASPPPERPSDRDDGVLERARDARLTLLARKYEGVATPEDTARLRLLTERLRRLAPRVTSEDIDRLGGMVADAEAIHSTVASIKSKYGL